MEDELLPKQQIPLFTPMKWSTGKAEANTHGSNDAAGVARIAEYNRGSPLRDSI